MREIDENREERREAFYARHRGHMTECPDCGWWFCGLLACDCRTSRVFIVHTARREVRS